MPIVLPPNLSTKTVAVNVLLQAIGESPINSVDETESVDATSALATLQEVMVAVQSEGWHWNREYSLELSPEADKSIPLPANCLWIASAYWSNDRSTPANLTERGRKLYDHETHSAVSFTASVVVDMIVLLEWEEMPEYARRYVTIRAAQLFQGRIQTSSTIARIQEPEVDSARATLEHRESEANPDNQITGNRQQMARLGGRNVRRRNF